MRHPLAFALLALVLAPIAAIAAGYSGGSPITSPFAITEPWAAVPGGTPHATGNCLNTSLSPTCTVVAGYSAASATINPAIKNALIIAMGQSQIGAYSGTTPYSPVSALLQMVNIYDQGIYTYKDPMLSPDGAQSSYLGALGDGLISDGKFDRVIWLNCAIGGTSVAEWANAGDYSGRIRTCLTIARTINTAVTAIIWDQGAEDTALGTSTVAYQASLAQVIGTIRGHGITAKIFLTRDTWDGVAASTNVRTALANTANGTDIILGADFDPPAIPTAKRQGDMLHFTGSGAGTGSQAAADLQRTVLEANLP